MPNLTPSPCNISDIINEIVKFVDANPNWMENNEDMERLSRAYMILASMSQPDMVTDEEYEFIMDIHTTIRENAE